MTENPQIPFTHFLSFSSSNALGNFNTTQNMPHLEALHSVVQTHLLYDDINNHNIKYFRSYICRNFLWGRNEITVTNSDNEIYKMPPNMKKIYGLCSSKCTACSLIVVIVKVITDLRKLYMPIILTALKLIRIKHIISIFKPMPEIRRQN